MTWLQIGSSPTVAEALPLARSQFCIDKTITCNRGIKLEPRPNVYLCIDMNATRMFAEQARAAQAAGTTLVTLQRGKEALRERDCDWYNEFLPTPPGPPQRHQWGEFRYSGPKCVEYACRRGASRVVLVGCDGYTGDADYFDGYQQQKTPVAEVHQKWTVDGVAVGFAQVAAAFPDVEFVQIGKPVFRVGTSNWRVEWL